MKNLNQKGFSKIILILIIALALIAIYVYSNSKNRLVNQTQISTTSNSEVGQFSIPQYGFTFSYPKDELEVRVLQAASSDYLPVGREFVAIYEKNKYQDFHARIDIHSKVPMSTVIKDNSYIQKNTAPQDKKIGSNVWSQINNYYVLEKDGTTYTFHGPQNIAQKILPTVIFSK